MICPQYKPIIGGYERAAERLSAALVAKGHMVTVIAERRDFSWRIEDEDHGVQIRRLWCLYRVHLHMISSLASFALFLLMQGRSFQVWHIHQYGLHATLAVVLSKLLRRPVVLQLTSSGVQGIFQETATLPMGRLAQFLLRQVTAAVTLSRETQVEAEAFGIDTSRIHLLGTGVEIKRFRPRSNEERVYMRKKFGMSARGWVVFVGRLSAEKNPDGLLRAWKIARTNFPEDWKLVLVGDGPMREELEPLAEEGGLTTSVILAGEQSNVETWMGAADIYVLPSYNEGLSNTMLEAMATGLPVISTRVSGSIEVLEENAAGLVVDIGQMGQLADALVCLASDPALRNRMGQAGRAVIEKIYSIERIAERHEQLYRGLLFGQKGHLVGDR